MKTELEKALDWLRNYNGNHPNDEAFIAGQNHISVLRTLVNQERRTFAAMAMQGMCANPDFLKMYVNLDDSVLRPDPLVYQRACEAADALIAELNKGERP